MSWRVGDRVRFVGAYEVPAALESVPVARVSVGTLGVVVAVKPDSIWVAVEGLAAPVTLWFPDAFPDDFGKTTLVEKLA